MVALCQSWRQRRSLGPYTSHLRGAKGAVILTTTSDTSRPTRAEPVHEKETLYRPHRWERNPLRLWQGSR